MQYIWQHIQAIITTYTGSLPLSHFLKQYYKRYPKLGSRDRRILNDMAYAWYRCSKGFKDDLPFKEKIGACLYLCYSGSKHTVNFIPVHLHASLASSVDERMQNLSVENIPFYIEQLAPVEIELSEGINKQTWLWSMLQQPDLFIRVRNKQKVVKLLEKNNIVSHWITDTCLRIANNTAIDKILPEDMYVVQDASSQQTGNHFHPGNDEHWWDCCSGAGGKSLLLKDLNKKVDITVSDRRESIIHNLRQRFKQYHLQLPETYVLDITSADAVRELFQGKQFDNIICDVPCTGSGTWARTPEQLYFFASATTTEVSQLQTRIAINVKNYLKEGGRLFYITCSVFEAENENVVNRLLQENDLKLETTELINGISNKADSMFVAVLSKK